VQTLSTHRLRACASMIVTRLRFQGPCSFPSGIESRIAKNWYTAFCPLTMGQRLQKRGEHVVKSEVVATHGGLNVGRVLEPATYSTRDGFSVCFMLDRRRHHGMCRDVGVLYCWHTLSV
jgi:hypothetical protein